MIDNDSFIYEVYSLFLARAVCELERRGKSADGPRMFGGQAATSVFTHKGLAEFLIFEVISFLQV